jgi:uncharacterized membrane protein YjgN (DUF898 family)
MNWARLRRNHSLYKAAIVRENSWQYKMTSKNIQALALALTLITRKQKI